MTIPENFAEVSLGFDTPRPSAAQPAASGGASAGEAWTSPEGIDILPVYGPEHLDGLDGLDTLAGHRAVPARALPDDVHDPAVDDPAVRRLLHRRGVQRVLPPQPRRRAERPVGRLRPRHPPRLRLRPPARAGDVGMAGVAIDSIYDMRTLFDGIPLDQMSVSMTMNGAVLPVLALYIAAAEEQGVRRSSSRGRSRTTSSRSSWSATPTSIRRRPRCGSSPTSSPTPRRRCRASTRSRSPATTSRRPGATADLELAYTLADGVEYIRAGLAAGYDDRPVRAAPVVLLGDRDELLHGGRQDARGPGAVGAAGRPVRPEEPQVALAAHPQPDLGLVADRAGRLQQRDAHLYRGDGVDAGPHPVAAHQRPRRGDRTADRLLGADRPQHPAAAAAGERHHRASSTRGPARTTSSG
jgi:hypothetical protein